MPSVIGAGERHDRSVNVPVEIGLTGIGLLLSIGAGSMFLLTAINALDAAFDSGRALFGLEIALFGLLAAALFYGNVAYQLARLGYLRRLRTHRHESAAELDELYDLPAPAVHVLVPAYQEEARVVRQTLLSAALQPYPGITVTLLIDDNPVARSAEDAALLDAARRLPAEVADLLAQPAAWTAAALAEFTQRLPRSASERRRAAGLLADLWDRAAGHLEAMADAENVRDHTDVLFVEQILRRPAAECRRRAGQLRARSRGLRSPSAVALAREHARLAALFDVRLSSFERKRYANLSHEPNKAMNLNSYISLLGGRWTEARGDDGLHLVAADGREPAELDVAKPDAIVTLDADSLLLPDYVVRLIRAMTAPGNERVAIIQTPYSAVPGARSPLEQTAGATTDIQYIIHQGFSRHDATFWVGANALIRMQALQEIATHDHERGHRITRYIQDRTVIEDTESTVDLVARGWQLVNYPARLSFSATPPDFGSLVIQRRRWANGGLIIVPKLLRHLAASVLRRRPALTEGFLRLHYLISIAATNLALLILLAYPFPDGVASAWLPLAAAPYFLLYARDLRQAGYRWRELIHVYALNLLLLPVNLAGVAKSVQQGLTRRKIPFGRTPKVDGRTAAPLGYSLAAMGLVLFWLVGSVTDVGSGRTLHAAFAGVNAGLLVYAITRFIGWRQMLADARDQLRLGPARRLRSAAAAIRL